MLNLKRLYIKYLFLVLIFLLSNTAFLFAEGKWSVNSNVQFSRGKYLFEDNTNTYFLYGGVRYRTSKWSLFANVPLIAQNNDLVTNTGSTILPSIHHENQGSSGSGHHGGMTDDNGISHFIMGLGDLYVSGEYLIFAEGNGLPYIAGNVKLKIPTAGTTNNFGTGKLDYGFGFSARKQIKGYLAVVDLGFWGLGDPQGLKYNDIHSFGAGVGRFFNQNRYGMMLYFETYSKILSDIEANRQISLGLNYRINAKIIFSVIGATGLSNASPDISFSSGLEWSI